MYSVLWNHVILLQNKLEPFNDVTTLSFTLLVGGTDMLVTTSFQSSRASWMFRLAKRSVREGSLKSAMRFNELPCIFQKQRMLY